MGRRPVHRGRPRRAGRRIRDSGERGAQAYQDIKDYVSGINSFIDDTVGALSYPGEYVLTGHGSKIKDFTPNDVVAIASVIGSIFGNGGGGEVGNALAKLSFQQQYGKEKGESAYAAWRAQNDSEATTTVHDKEFPYARSPKNPDGVAKPDRRGSVTPFDHSQNEYRRQEGDQRGKQQPQSVLPPDLITSKKGMSNALMVSGKHTASGNPVAVYGPQTGYSRRRS